MKIQTLALLVQLASATFLSGCAALPDSNALIPPLGEKQPYAPSARVEARFLTYGELRAMAEKNPELNKRLHLLAPAMAYDPGVAHADVVPPVVVDAAAFAAKEILGWLGDRLEAEAQLHSAQFAAFVEQASWWGSSQPVFAAIELTRTTGKGASEKRVFDAVVLIRPVIGTTPGIAAFRLMPVYLLETEAGAKDFTDKMGAVMSIHIEASWTEANGDPVNAVLVDYAVTGIKYELGKPCLFDGADQPHGDAPAGAAGTGDLETSHFFAMPLRPSTIGVRFGYAETDPSKWVGLLDKLGKAIGGQADNASNAIKKNL
jgi:hypothetical protein